MNTKILLVEDDPFWYVMIGEYLRAQYQEIEFRSVQSTQQATVVLKNNPNAYDLIISDYFLHEEATGVDLWRECQSMGSQIPFLIISGLKKSEFLDLIGDEPTIPHYIEKPFDFKKLSQVIDEVKANKGVRRV